MKHYGKENNHFHFQVFRGRTGAQGDPVGRGVDHESQGGGNLIALNPGTGICE